MGTKDATLKVLYYNRHVGTIQVVENGNFTFSYSREWILAADSWPISRMIPLSTGINSHEYKNGRNDRCPICFFEEYRTYDGRGSSGLFRNCIGKIPSGLWGSQGYRTNKSSDQ